MKKRKDFRLLMFWCFTFLVMLSCDHAGNVENPDLHYFVKYYGGDGDQYGVDMLPLDDGSFILLGNYSNGNLDTEVYLMRVDAEGGVIWEKRFRQFPDDNWNAKDLEATIDGNFMVLADFQKEVQTSQTPWQFKLLKISPAGDLLDSASFGEIEANDFSHSVTALPDGGFIVSGTTEFTETFLLVNNPDPDLGDFFNYRIDQDLNQLMENEWSPVSPGFGGKLDVAVKTLPQADPSQGFYVFGHSNINLNNTNPNRKLGLFYFHRGPDGGEDLNFFPGNVLNVNDTEISFVNTLPEEMGGGFVVIGTSSTNLGVSEIFFARLRTTLSFTTLQNDAMLYHTIPLQRNIRGVSAASSLTGEYGYLVLGNEVRSTGATNFWLSKIDQSGGVLWSTTFGSEAEDDYGAAVAQLADGKIVILGTMGLADNQFKMAFIKMNPRGQLLK